MLKHTRTRFLSALDGAGWTRPSWYRSDPAVVYADGGQGGDGDGGSDGDGDGAGDSDADGDGDDSDAGDQDGDQDDADADLGEKGKKALRELRKQNRQLKAQLRAAPKASAKGGGKGAGDDAGDGQADADQIREQVRQEVQAEVWTERVESAVVAAAAGRLANPQLAARLLADQLSEVGEDAKGRPDRTALNELIDELLDEEPYLAVKSAKDDGDGKDGKGRRFEGGADGGARSKSKKTAANLGEAVAARLAGKSG